MDISYKMGILNELQQFISENGIVGTTAGVIIAMSTKDLITSLVSDIIYPSMIAMWPGTTAKLRINYDVAHFFQLFITWLITLVITYYFIKTTFQYFLGVSLSTKKPT